MEYVFHPDNKLMKNIIDGSELIEHKLPNMLGGLTGVGLVESPYLPLNIIMLTDNNKVIKIYKIGKNNGIVS